MGSLAGYLAAAGVPFRCLDLFQAVPAAIAWDEAAGLVVLGGPMSAGDIQEFPFLAIEQEWIREAVGRELPVLGICLGAQLLAKSLGARVYRNPRREIGWYEIELLPAAADDRLFRDGVPRETVFQWHADTFDLPAGAIHLARSPLCGNQAFRYGPRAYGVQFHVEMMPHLMEEWLSEEGFQVELAESQEFDPEQIRHEGPGRFPRMGALSQRLLGRFAAMCRADE